MCGGWKAAAPGVELDRDEPLTANALIALSEASTTWRSAPDGCPPRRKAPSSEADPGEPPQAAGRIQLVSCDERYVEAVVPEHNVLGSLYRAWCHRLLDDDRLGVEVLRRIMPGHSARSTSTVETRSDCSPQGVV